MTLSKQKRKRVYTKFNGHCAYCGTEITYENMQVDHIVSRSNGGTDDINNLYPSCGMCNLFKGPLNLKLFRREIKKQTESICNHYQVRMALAYGLIQKTNTEVSFYFEKKKH